VSVDDTAKAECEAWFRRRYPAFQETAALLARTAGLRSPDGEMDILRELYLVLLKNWSSRLREADDGHRDRFAFKTIRTLARRFRSESWRATGRSVPLDNAEDLLVDPGALPDEETVDAIFSGQVREALLTGIVELLTDDERDVIVLTYDFGLTYAEAGRELGLSAKAASRLHESAVKKLRGALTSPELGASRTRRGGVR
jgi:RNA polymerase sigma factor (sigma-70 family)